MGTQKGGKKGRKIGRNLKWCQSYRNRNQRAINKARNLIRHFSNPAHIHDNTAFHCLTNLPADALAKAKAQPTIDYLKSVRFP